MTIQLTVTRIVDRYIDIGKESISSSFTLKVFVLLSPG